MNLLVTAIVKYNQKPIRRSYVVKTETDDRGEIESAIRAQFTPDYELVRIAEVCGENNFVETPKGLYLKVRKGHGESVHIAKVYNGRVSSSPDCGSGTCNIGTRTEYGGMVTTRAVTCKKCLARLEKVTAE